MNVGLILGLLVLLLVAIVVSVIQAGLALAIMYAMNKYMHDKLPETHYGAFSFDGFEKKDFNELLVRLMLIFLIPTAVIHLAENAILGLYIRKAPLLYCALLVVLETAAIAGGFFYFFKLDAKRLGILTAASAVIYIILLWYPLWNFIG